MELIIKPTELCNFKCTFCSSTEIASSKTKTLPHDQIFQFLKRFPSTNTIIVNGGDPLMVSPEYYWKLIDHLETHNLKTIISMTTNLWAFFKNPNKWQDLLKHPRVGVCTSFNYGSTRRVTHEMVYTEELFWQVSDLFLERIGYRPEFISVINDDNEDTALDNVRLAQKMNVVCKLNYAMASGAQGKPYTLSKIYAQYIEVYKQGLTPWEFNTQQMIKRLKKKATVCPQNRSCDTGIRCLQPDGDYYSCGSFGDDREYKINFAEEMESPVTLRPLLQDINIQFLKDECLTCPMFDICNGCKKTIKDLKHHDLVEDHCQRMKSISQEIIQISNQGQAEIENIKTFGLL
ncbi:MAG: radical SAM protein [Bdellovibrionales bacterium]